MAIARTCGARHRRYESYILVQGFCGLRPGEARELSRGDFDLKATPATVTTCGTYTDVAAKYLDEGESRDRPLKGRGPKARRTIPIPAQLVPYLQRHLRPVRDQLEEPSTATPDPTREKLFERDNPLRCAAQDRPAGPGHRRLSMLLNIYVGVMREDAATSLARVEASLSQVLDDTETSYEP